MNKKNLVKPKNQLYCSYCGSEMIETMEGAEKNMMFYSDSPSIPFSSAYDKKTGKRQFCYRYTCPNWKNGFLGIFYSQHDDYFIDEIITL